MDFKAHIEYAWKLTLEYIISLVLMTLVLIVVGFLSFGILGPVTMVGYMHSILRMVRDGREPKIQDLFSHMNLFLPLLIFYIVAAIALAIGFTIFVLPGIIISVGITFCWIYMNPIMTDRGLGVIDAAKESFMLAKSGNIMEHLIVVLIFLGITWIGSLVPVIGNLFTQPLATVFVISAYLERTSERMPVSPSSPPPPPEI